MNALKELREYAETFDSIYTRNLLLAIADRIENEWMELPRDKDGEVIHIGDVMNDRDGNETIVDKVCSGGFFVGTGNGCFLVTEGFTHVKPDTWERIEADATTPEERNIVRRCKRLAGVYE